MTRACFQSYLLLILLVGCSSPQKTDSVQPQTGSESAKASSPAARRGGTPPYKEVVLKNGLHVLIVEKPGLPAVSFGLMLKTGSVADPAGKSGLTNMMAHLLDKGTVTQTASEVADEVENLGAQFEADVSEDYCWLVMNGLSFQSDKLIKIFTNLLMKPGFSDKEIDREKKTVLAGLTQLPDQPEQFTELIFRKYLFGAHPYGRPVAGASAEIPKISRKDLIKQYLKIFRPQNAILVVAGDIDQPGLDRLLRNFEVWKSAPSLKVQFPEVVDPQGLQILAVDQPQSTQAHIIFGARAIKRSDPDFLALRLANVILGGSFASRLVERVREKLGLTYHIVSELEGGLDREAFQVETFTKQETVHQAFKESLGIYSEFTEKGVTGAEVASAKNYLIGHFTRSIETADHFGFNLALLKEYSVPDAYLKNFVRNVNSVSPDQVNAAIKRHLQSGNLKAVVYGNMTAIGNQLQGLGKLEIKKANEVFAP